MSLGKLKAGQGCTGQFGIFVAFTHAGPYSMDYITASEVTTPCDYSATNVAMTNGVTFYLNRGTAFIIYRTRNSSTQDKVAIGGIDYSVSVQVGYFAFNQFQDHTVNDGSQLSPFLSWPYFRTSRLRH